MAALPEALALQSHLEVSLAMARCFSVERAAWLRRLLHRLRMVLLR